MGFAVCPRPLAHGEMRKSGGVTLADIAASIFSVDCLFDPQFIYLVICRIKLTVTPGDSGI
jgi:hypothetical protein